MKKLAMILIAAGAVLSPRAFAWSDSGHQVTGIIACRTVDEGTREAVVALLREHPFYTRDFAAKPAEADEAEWLFAQAACWPDIARGDEAHDHKTWHYINIPLRMSGTANVEWGENVSREWAEGMDLENLNIMQALAKARADVANMALPAADRAIALCWLFHLVGDLHQPLHTVAFITPVRFVEGDRGGNLIPVKPGGNLHAYWDGLLGRDLKWNKVTDRAGNLMEYGDFRITGERAARDLDPEKWLQESIGTAQEYVYTFGMHAHIMEHEACTELPAKELNYQYKYESRDAAYTRVTQAGYRLGSTLEQLVN